MGGGEGEVGEGREKVEEEKEAKEVSGRE